MPYGRNKDDMEEEEPIEVSSPACLMGVVDWDYGFDNFFSEDIANRRRSCHKSKSQSQQQQQHQQQPELSQQNKNQPTSTSCNNNNNNGDTTDSCSKNNQKDDTAIEEPQQKPEQQQQETNNNEQKDALEDFFSPNSVSTATTVAIPPLAINQEAWYTKSEDNGTTEDFSDFFGADESGEEWIQGDIIDDDDDDFGSLSEFKQDDSQEKARVKEDTHNHPLLKAWESVLTQVYLDGKTMIKDPNNEQIPSHGPKSIRHYVLEEAHESVHSKVTWTSVTYSMDQDTGFARVKWPYSRIEEMYLNALDCKHQKLTTPHVPSMLTIGEDDDDNIDDDSHSSEDNDILPSTLSETALYQPPTPTSAKPPTAPSASSIKSPIFGFSFSKLLPRLSTTSLPRSDSSAPTSATSSTQRYSLESIPRTSSGTGTTSPGKDHSLSRTSSPTPSYRVTASPPPIIPTQQQYQSNQHDKFHTLTQQVDEEDYDEFISSKTPKREKRYSMPVTSNVNGTQHPVWKPSLNNNSIITSGEPSPQQQQQQRRRPMTMINTTLANKSFSILDLDDTNDVTLVSTPPPSSKAFSFTPLVPTPTRALTMPLTPIKKEGTSLLSSPPPTPLKNIVEKEEKIQNNNYLGDLHDLTIGDSLPAVLSPVSCETKQEEDQEFGEFAEFQESNNDDFGDFVLSNEQEEEEEEWGDWSGGCNNNFTVITSH